jgi:hypothetical protein
MHGTTRPRPAIHPVGTGVNAVVWIEPGRAIVIRGPGVGEPAALELPIPMSPSSMPPVLAEVAHTIGDVDRVLVMGTDDLRTALEREIVAIGHHPEAIRDEPHVGRMDEAALVARWRRLV